MKNVDSDLQCVTSAENQDIYKLESWRAAHPRGGNYQRTQGKVNAVPDPEMQFGDESNSLPTYQPIYCLNENPFETNYAGSSQQQTHSHFQGEINRNRSDSEKAKEYKVSIKVDNNPIVFELDTAASVSIIGETTYKSLFSQYVLKPPTITLKSYCGQTLDLLGEISVPVKYHDQKKTIPLIVAKGEKPALLGRNWLKEIQLDWGKIFAIRDDSKLDNLLSKYQEVFTEQKGVISGFEADIHVPESATPIFRKSYQVPYSVQDGVKTILQAGVESGVYRRVDSSSWASPMVAVAKESGGFRLCGDYKVTVNQVLEPDPYPPPCIEELLAKLGSAKYFSKIDLADAFQQLKLSERSKELLTVNTTIGLLQYERMPYGIKTAPQIFQRVMDEILHGIEGVVCYIDDILITSNSKEGHYGPLEEVLKRLQKHDVHAHITKCSFLKDSVEYLGHGIGSDGVPRRARALQKTARCSVTSRHIGRARFWGNWKQIYELVRGFYSEPRNTLAFCRTSNRMAGDCRADKHLCNDTKHGGVVPEKMTPIVGCISAICTYLRFLTPK